MTIVRTIAWGRTLGEYRAMFALDGPASSLGVLDVAAGPASFTAEWTGAGGRAIACDPLYRRAPEAIAAEVAAAESAVRDLIRAQPDRFVWTTFRDPEALIAARRDAARRFLADYPEGRAEGRYVPAALPCLPFRDEAFDLALCSHFLFLYSTAFDAAFHEAALEDLARVAREARIFPLTRMEGGVSPHLEPVVERLARKGYDAAVEDVRYEVQRGGDRMLRLRAPR